jgi:hypothetical protein
MTIDRRSFLVGAAATVAAVTAPPAFAVPVPAPPDIRSASMSAVRFCEDMEEGVGHRAMRRFTFLSRWYFDPNAYPGYPLLRHEGSRLTFMVQEDPDYQIYVRRIFLPTDPADLTEARHLLIGTTARRVAIHTWPYNWKTRFAHYFWLQDLRDMTRFNAHERNHGYRDFEPPIGLDVA